MGEAMAVGVDYLEPRPPSSPLWGDTCSAPRGTCGGREWWGVSRGQKTHLSHRAGRAGLGGVHCVFLFASDVWKGNSAKKRLQSGALTQFPQSRL